MRLNEKQLLWWEKARARGVVHFVLMRGVLGYGVLGAILFTSYMHLSLDYEVAWTLPRALVLWPIGGVVVFLWQWHSFNRDYPVRD